MENRFRVATETFLPNQSKIAAVMMFKIEVRLTLKTMNNSKLSVENFFEGYT